MRLLCESVFILIGIQTLIQKNGRMKSFSYETKASMSFILMRRMSLWCPILKRKEITVWIRVCPHWQTSFNYKKWWKEKLLFLNQRINVIHPNEENEFMVPKLEKKEGYYVNIFSSQLASKLSFQKMVEWKAFLTKPKH